jgi:GGDEF domain-containing protein
VIEPWNRSQGDDGPEPDRPSFSLKAARRVVEAMRAPFTVQGESYTITISIGIAYSSTPSSSSATPDGTTVTNATDVLGEADAAMYRAKRQGKNRVEVAGAPAGPETSADAGADVR